MFSLSTKLRSGIIAAVSIGLFAATVAIPADAVSEVSLPTGQYMYSIDCAGGTLREVDEHSASGIGIGTPSAVEGSRCGYQPAFDSTTGTAYYLAGNNDNGTWPLVIIDPTTGQSSLVADIWEVDSSTPLTGGFASIAIDGNGGAVFVKDHILYTLNLTSGQVIPVAVDLAGTAIIFASAYNPVDGVLYLIDEDGNIWDYNPGLGIISWDGALPHNGNYSLQIDSAGTFWVSTNNGELASFNFSDFSGSYSTAGTFFPYSGALLITTVQHDVVPAATTPEWIDNGLAPFEFNAAYTDSVQASTNDLIYYSISAGQLPDGLALDESTGIVSGTPTRADSYGFEISAVTAGGSISELFSGVITSPTRGCVDYSQADYLGAVILNPDGTVIGCDYASQSDDIKPIDWETTFGQLTSTWQPYDIRLGGFCDDCSVGIGGFNSWNSMSEGGIPLGFSLNFFGTTYDSVFVNSNGSVSFGAGSSNYSEPLDQILNGEAGVVAYGADMENSELYGADSLWGTERHGDFFYWGRTQYEGQNAFVVTWMNQLTYPSDVEGTDFNTYQIILLDRNAGDGNIIINYGSMLTTQAHGYSRSSGCEAESQNCIAAGIGTVVDGYPLYASLQDDNGFLYNGLPLEDVADSGTHPLNQGHLNSDVPGRFIFEMRSGTVAEVATGPGIPENVAATSDGSDGIDVSWETPSDTGGSPLTGYEVSYRLQGSSASWRTINTSDLTVNINNMPVGTYEIKVVAINAVGTSAFSEIVTAAGGIPMAPVWNDNLFPTFQVGVETDLLFTAASGTDVYYQILDGDLPDGVTFDNYTGQFSGTPTTDAPYAFQIQAENENGITYFPVEDRVRSTNPFLVDGSPVELSPGEIVVFNDDYTEDVSSRTTINHELGGNDLLVEADAGNLRLTGSCRADTRCSVTQDENNNQVLSLFDEGTISVSGTGFMPGTTVFVYANSTPRLLGSVRVQRNGTYSASFPLTGLTAGNHTVQARGVGASGSERAENVGVVVAAGILDPISNPGTDPGISSATSDSEELVHTGSNSEQIFFAAAFLAALGIALLILSSRRKNQ